MKKIIIIVILALFGYIFLGMCGKVVQDKREQKEHWQIYKENCEVQGGKYVVSSLGYDDCLR